ncbi:MAG TPA: hypothetical protein VNF50_04555 [Acidimicrobiales bacterium]|nr:hypothetical protein [Acidimicrobiales bacterium]
MSISGRARPDLLVGAAVVGLVVVAALALAWLAHRPGGGVPAPRSCHPPAPLALPALSVLPAGLAVGISPGADVEHLTPSALAREFGSMRSAGARWVRLDVFWPDAEPAPGRYYFCQFDNEMVQARKAGLSVLLVMTYGPDWSRSHEADFAGFAGVVARRYSGLGINEFEIWNEPNLGANWWGGRADPAGYTGLLRAGAGAIHQVDPAAVVVAGALAESSGGSGNLTPGSFLSGMYAAGAKGSYQALSVHPYSFPAPPVAGDPANGWSLVRTTRALMAAHHDPAGLWLTEYGAPTGPNGVSDAQQATEIAGAFRLSRTTPGVRALFIFEWIDNSYDPAFGLLDGDGTAKPSLRTFTDEAAR